MKSRLTACAWGALLLASVACNSEKKAEKQDTPPPGVATKPQGEGTPPPAEAQPSGEVCKDGGGQNSDAESAAWFARSFSVEGGAKYCLDPKGEVLTYGEKGKLTMDEVCTTAFDGECEVYKGFGLKRVVALSYVDDAGKGVNAEVVLSRFATVDGAYAMFTKRVVADGDAKGDGVPKVLEAGGRGAIGTGRAYVWRGQYLAELQYNSDSESPSALIASSAKVLTALGKELGEKLPGDKALPASAAALPSEHLVANGVQYWPKEVPGFGAVGPAAYGFYDDGGVRVRLLSVSRGSEAEAKGVMASLKSKHKAEALKGLGDEALALKLGEGDAAVEYVVLRKGAQVFGVGDEEFALKAGGKALGREALIERGKALASAQANKPSGTSSLKDSSLK